MYQVLEDFHLPAVEVVFARPVLVVVGGRPGVVRAALLADGRRRLLRLDDVLAARDDLAAGVDLDLGDDAGKPSKAGSANIAVALPV